MSYEICNLSCFHFLSACLQACLRVRVVSFNHGVPVSGFRLIDFNGATMSRVFELTILKNETRDSVFEGAVIKSEMVDE